MIINIKKKTRLLDDDDDIVLPLTQYYFQNTSHSNYLQILPIIEELKER